MNVDVSLYGIIDPQVGQGRDLAELALAAAQNGATLIQFRAKAMPTRGMIEQARAIRLALEGTAVPLLINDRVDVALASGAAGVHLGRDDMRPEDARALLGPDSIIGATVKNEADLEALVGTALSYACIGGVFATTHKDNADAPLGVEGFRQLRDSARARLGAIPVGAIAGIEAGNAAGLIRAGADGIAVIGAMFGVNDVASATGKLAAAVALARSVNP